MENEAKPKTKHPDRVTLTPEALSQLNKWIEETKGRLRGSRISRSDLVNFLIRAHSDHLSERELEELENQHFDEIRFAAWALAQIKEAKAQGKTLSLAEVINAAQPLKNKGDNYGSTSTKSK